MTETLELKNMGLQVLNHDESTNTNGGNLLWLAIGSALGVGLVVVLAVGIYGAYQEGYQDATT